jgi:hypothetical protein
LQTNYSHRTIISFYLALIYAIVIFKPVLPIINDAFSHLFAEAIHIATVHAKYGANHLQKEIAETCADNDKSKTQNTVKVEDLVTVHVCTGEYNYACYFGKDKNYNTATLSPIAEIFLSFESPPPKFC